MTGDKTTREKVVEQLRGHADELDARNLTLREAADETRRVAREIERDGTKTAVRTDGGGAVQRARSYGVAGVELTESVLGDVLYALTLGLWMAAGSVSSTQTTLICALGGVVTLAVANRLKGWSA